MEKIKSAVYWFLKKVGFIDTLVEQTFCFKENLWRKFWRHNFIQSYFDEGATPD
jgi:hypothetical protein